MQRQRQKKNRFNQFNWTWNYMGKPTVKKEKTLDELIDEWEKESKERLRDLYLED